jgi:hypothetical protein
MLRIRNVESVMRDTVCAFFEESLDVIEAGSADVWTIIARMIIVIHTIRAG